MSTLKYQHLKYHISNATFRIFHLTHLISHLKAQVFSPISNLKYQLLNLSISVVWPYCVHGTFGTRCSNISTIYDEKSARTLGALDIDGCKERLKAKKVHTYISKPQSSNLNFSYTKSIPSPIKSPIFILHSPTIISNIKSPISNVN